MVNVTCLLVTFLCMSKRSNTLKEAHPVKRTRLALGFWLAHPPQTTHSQPTQPGNTSLFVTVNQPDERCGILQAQHRVLSSTSGPPAETSTSKSPHPPPPANFEDSVPPLEAINDQDPTGPQEEPTVKPKRKRYTTTAVSDVSYWFPCWTWMKFVPEPTYRMDWV